MEETYKRLLELRKEAPKAKEILANIEAYDSPSSRVIEDIDWIGEEIHWNDIKGRLKTTKFGQFNNKVSKIKKSILRVTDKP